MSTKQGEEDTFFVLRAGTSEMTLKDRADKHIASRM
jgi:hypothetical protein